MLKSCTAYESGLICDLLAPPQLRTEREKKQHKNLAYAQKSHLHEIKLHLKMTPPKSKLTELLEQKSEQRCNEKALPRVALKRGYQ
ncbi:hypothetical protein [Phyllobacterium pellucidum]|uniref:hypothetical protein n=1 Tax=Phyllobacterium pellucidum TaxID=2740464 RepID=UPI001D149CE9|nr:hypothetical protein [Phyllobacterium sp. T1018]UGY11380.1 hypothetical protein LLE51_017885 [Phyllobacterium sp. T1018]